MPRKEREKVNKSFSKLYEKMTEMARLAGNEDGRCPKTLRRTDSV